MQTAEAEIILNIRMTWFIIPPRVQGYFYAISRHLF